MKIYWEINLAVPRVNLEAALKSVPVALVEIAREVVALSTVVALVPSIAAVVPKGMGNARVVAAQERMEKADAAVASTGAAAKIAHLAVQALAADHAVNQNPVVLAAQSQTRMK